MSISRLFILFVIILAFGSRFYGLETQSLWSDEGNSLALTQVSYSQIAARTASDIHPPFYYWLLKFWVTGLGRHEFAARSLSAALGVLLVAIIYVLGRHFFRKEAGLIAAILALISPFQVYYAQETRMYILMTVLGALSIWAAYAWWYPALQGGPKDRKIRKNRWSRILAGISYIIVITAGLYTHYAFPVMLIVINGGVLFILWQRWIHSKPESPWSQLIRWGILQGLPLVLYLPWMPIAYRQLTTWPSSLLVQATPFEIFTTLLSYLSLGLSGKIVSSGWLWLFFGVLCMALPGFWVFRTRRPLILLTWLWLLLPAGLTAILFRPAYLKFLLIASPAFCLLLSLGVINLSVILKSYRNTVRAQSLVVSFFLIGLLIPSSLSFRATLSDPSFYRDNYRGIVAYLNAIATKNDAIIIHAPGQAEVFHYYYDQTAAETPVYPLPETRPLDPVETQSTLEAISRDAEQIYGIYWATEEADPDGLIETWLNRHNFKARDIWFGNVRLVSYATPIENMALTPADHQFGDAVQLLGYSLPQAELIPGKILQMGLVWQSTKPLVESYTVFVQLLDEANHIVGQRDALPLVPSLAWSPDNPILDQHGVYLEPGTPPRPVRVIVGLYNTATGERLIVDQKDDFLELATINIIRSEISIPDEALQMQYHLPGPRLLGYDLYKLGHASAPETPLYPGDPFHLVLYWRATLPLPDQDNLVFELRNRQDQILVRWPAQAAGIDYPMNQWQPGEVVRGQFTRFLTGIPPDSYYFKFYLNDSLVGAGQSFEVQPE